MIVDISSVEARFAYFDQHTDFWSLVVYPLFAAFVFTVVSPFIAYGAMWIGAKPSSWQDILQITNEAKAQSKRNDLRRVEQDRLAIEESEVIRQAETDQELESIKDESARQAARERIEALRRQQEAQTAPSGPTFTGTGTITHAGGWFSRHKGKAGSIDPFYMHEKLASAVDALLPPYGKGEAASIAAAFNEINLGMMGVDFDSIQDSEIRSRLQKVRDFMDTEGLSDPGSRGLYAVKAASMSDEDKREFSHAVRELESYFRGLCK